MVSAGEASLDEENENKDDEQDEIDGRHDESLKLRRIDGQSEQEIWTEQALLNSLDADARKSNHDFQYGQLNFQRKRIPESLWKAVRMPH